jgi:hypothetical protein
LFQDIAAVRDAVLDAAGNAWQGARSATVDVMNYQYGEQVGQAVSDEACKCSGLVITASDELLSQSRQGKQCN